MTKPNSHACARTLRLLAVLILTLSAGFAAKAADAAGAQAAPAVDAESVLSGMARFMAAAQTFSVTVHGAYDAIQEDGSRIEFSNERRVTVARPNKLRIDSRDSDGTVDVVTFDGQTLTSSRPAAGVYAQAAFAGNVDGAIVHFVKDLRMRLPLAMLLVTGLPNELERRVKALAYVEKTTIDGVAAHHLAGSTDSVDFQVWVRDGAEPVPLKIVMTYRQAAGQPGFRAGLDGWNFSPAADDAKFTFVAPPAARRIAFLNQVTAVAANAQEKNK